ncbi:hypothetical protein QYM36_010063 [Artemia franciscana]|uniref:Uncharacterized protein n=1 Tax=Artemia franciscana TaxID=6661 RepID=A0AA88I4L5_ARTSF|nr:hypothetical protein QYM36_010063 [Artemia franciscana]
MNQHNIDILAISEIRWKGTGQENLHDGYALFYIGYDTHHGSGSASELFYMEKDKEIEKSAWKDKRLFLENKAVLAEEAARKGDSKTVYRLTHEMSGRQSSRITLFTAQHQYKYAKSASELFYMEKDKEIEKSAWKDKRLFLENKAVLAEEAARKGDSKTVYRLTHEMSGRQSSRITLFTAQHQYKYAKVC